jgi:ABC-type Fe3+/spermidine/putrescine transport system ATPase subunit
MSTVIELRGLRKEFDDVVAVQGADLDIEQGEFFTLLGPSGSGKTTILRMVAGLELPTDGTIRLDGRDVTDVAPYDRDVNTVFQDYALFPHMTVRENIGYGLEIRDADANSIDRRVEELLELVSLPGTGDRNIEELSGGQQQRVALARSLAIEPQVLLLDEPLGALDEKLRREMQIELKEIQEELGTTFLYVTHDQEEALSMSDRLAVLDGGRIVQVGTPEAVYKRPRSRFIAEFFRGSNIFEATVDAVPDGGVELAALGTTVLAARDDEAAPSPGDAVTFFVRSEGISVGTHGDNRLAGTVTNAVYRGGVTDYTLDIGDCGVVVTLGDDGYAAGDELDVSWDADDTVLLRE